MSENRFKRAENEYFRIKGLRATGSMTQEQFEAAVKELTVQDAQGHIWMIGADDGKWYFHDGKEWVQARPSAVVQPTMPVQRDNLPPPPPPSLAPSLSLPLRQDNGKMIATIVGGALLVCLCAALGLLAASSLGIVRLNLGGKSTPVVLPTPIIFPTPIPVPTLAPLPTIPPPPTATMPTSAPVVTATLTVTPTATATHTLTPTATATQTITPTVTATLGPTATPTITPLPQGNCADPNARWENMIDGQTIGALAAFVGTAAGENFSEYRVETGTPATVLYRSSTSVVHDVIFVWNTLTIANGDYGVTLTVVRKDGTTLAPCAITVRVRH